MRRRLLAAAFLVSVVGGQFNLDSCVAIVTSEVADNATASNALTACIAIDAAARNGTTHNDTTHDRPEEPPEEREKPEVEDKPDLPDNSRPRVFAARAKKRSYTIFASQLCASQHTLTPISLSLSLSGSKEELRALGRRETRSWVDSERETERDRVCCPLRVRTFPAREVSCRRDSKGVPFWVRNFKKKRRRKSLWS